MKSRKNWKESNEQRVHMIERLMYFESQKSTGTLIMKKCMKWQKVCSTATIRLM